jgi:hypothetical protein
MQLASMQDGTQMGETSKDIARYRPPSKFLLSGPLMHVFLSFRAGTEMHVTEMLYEAMNRLSRESYAIPPGARGKPCPQVAESTLGPDVCKVFFAKYSLLDGKDWETSISLALAHSLVVVPLLSWGQELDEEGNVHHTGSVGRMMNLRGDGDMVDNVLIEYILMLALKSHQDGSVCALILLLLHALVKLLEAIIMLVAEEEAGTAAVSKAVVVVAAAAASAAAAAAAAVVVVIYTRKYSTILPSSVAPDLSAPHP